MSDAKAFYEQFQRAVESLKTQTPDALRGFGGLFSAVMKAGALCVKHKELIALGIGVAQRCEPCIRLHVQKCLDAGAGRDEILEAAGVAVMMQGGPAYAHLPVVLEALDALAPAEG